MFVLDASATLPWCFPDEATDRTESLLAQLPVTRAFVPPIWPFEVATTLAVGERRGRLAQTDATRFITILRGLPITIDDSGSQRARNSVLQLARETRLSVYDASYLDLAMLRGLPLATIDARLTAAAEQVGVRLLL
jgi:predicted nucleic acid-binding protein